MMNISKYILFLIVLSLSCATTASGGDNRPEIEPGSWLRNVKVDYKADKTAYYGIVQIYFPKNYNRDAASRTLIVLHGYRQKPEDWETRTPIAEHANRYGLVLVCPAMTTTLYESRYYPETASRWAPVPGGEFISAILIGFLQKNFNLARERESTGIFGISTGARGALLLAAQHPKLFGAAAGLSGDYDSVSMKNDRLLVSMYGPYDGNCDRWENEVNILKLAESLRKTPVFLAHGTLDSIVPPPQTALLAGLLHKLAAEKGGYELVVEQEKSNGSGHDWTYWGRLVPDVLMFFDQKLKK
jgi:S-formylglutathione hydrolase FrmB